MSSPRWIDSALLSSARFAMCRSGILVGLVSRLRWHRAIDRLADLDAIFERILERNPSVNDLDEFDLAQLEQLYLRRQGLTLPADPFSDDYRRQLWDFYLSLRGTSQYSTDQEGNNYEYQRDGASFFPFHTQSAPRVGLVLSSMGTAIRGMGVPPRARIVEFGPGSGNFTFHLSLIGYHATAVEAGSGHVELIRHRCNPKVHDVNVVHADMLGLICLVDEPIYPSRCPQLPYAWGPMLGGLALLTIRRLGWLELGFQYRYLRRAFSRLGWKLHRMGTTPYAEDVCIARRTAWVCQAGRGHD